EQREFLQARMTDTDALLVAGEIPAPAGVDEEESAKGLRLACVIARLDGDEIRGRVVEPGDGNPFANCRARFFGVLQQQMIELGAFDLERGRLARVTPVAKDEFQAFGTVADVKLRPGLEGET